MFLNWFRRKQQDPQAKNIYQWALFMAKNNFSKRFKHQSRTERERLEKFEAIAVYMAMAVWFLKKNDKTQLAREAQEAMFEDFDSALREQGVGDLSVGGRIRKLAGAFMGRVLSYSPAFDAGDMKPLAMALRRNGFCEDSKLHDVAVRFIQQSCKMELDGLDNWLNEVESLSFDQNKAA